MIFFIINFFFSFNRFFFLNWFNCLIGVHKKSSSFSFLFLSLFTYVNRILLNLQIVLLFLHDMYRYVKLNQLAIQKARRILTFGQRSIAEKITSVDIYMSNSSAYITTNSIVIWKQLRAEYEKFSMSTKDVNVKQKFYSHGTHLLKLIS